MRSFMLVAACVLAVSVGLAACATLDEVDEKPEKPAANQKAVDEIVGMITGNKKPAKADAPKSDEKKGPVGGDWKTKMDEEKRKQEEARKKALEKQQKYALETKRTREEMERDKKRIVSAIQDDKIERKYRFIYVEPETTTLSPETLEAMRLEEEEFAEKRRKYGDWAVKEEEKKREAKRREEKQRADRENNAQRYSTETKRARAEMERDFIRIKEFIECDKGERKHRFVYVEPKTTEMPETTTKPPPSECKLTLKFPDGTTRVREYSPREQLAAVRLYVRLQNPSVPLSKIALSKGDKQFTGPMMKESFESLGLCPDSELNVKLN